MPGAWNGPLAGRHGPVHHGTSMGRVAEPAEPKTRREPQRGRLAASRNPDPSEESMATKVEAQIAGSLWKIEKRVGDVVEANDVIMIIESMKMEIPVEAPCAGTISEIRIQEGEAVEEGAVLALIE